MINATEKKAARPKTKRSDFDIEERLLAGEQVVRTAVISDYIYWRAGAVFVFALLVALFVAHELGVMLAIVSFIMAGYATMLKSILMLVVTNKRVLVRYGLLQVDVVDIHFDKVESVELKRMIPGFIMGYSDVVIMGTGNRYIVIPFVANGVELRRAYNEQSLSTEKAG